MLSKKLAQALGGDVILEESALGYGSTFIITIDPGTGALNSFSSQASLPKIKTENSVEAPNLKGAAILIADDSLDNQALISHLLRLSGATVDTADNGREAVLKASTGKFNLVLMDLQMPEMDGYEATKQLRTKGFSKPIIALTAHAMKEERRRCLESGFDEHLTKPINRGILLKTLSEHLN